MNCATRNDNRVLRALESASEPITIADICRRLHSSETPVRFALQRLIEDDRIHVAGQRARKSGRGGTPFLLYAIGPALEAQQVAAPDTPEDAPDLPAFVPYDFALRALMGARA